jgi:phosphoserine aminotransferase
MVHGENFMRKVFNFSPGPAMVAEEVLLQAQTEMLDWQGTGMSIMEVSHRGSEFKIIAEQAEADLRELLGIPKHYHVLFLAGGASTQFSMVPLNLFSDSKEADYIDTGIWSRKAIAEAKRYGTVNIAMKLDESSAEIRIPPQKEWALNPKANYVHYTPNETIGGVEFGWVPQTGSVPLVADMSSTILSRPIDVNAYGLIYACAQKNMGQAGITIVIIRDDLVKESLPLTPTLYQYAIHAKHKSFYNTPPTYSWYIAGLTFAWMKRQGGLKFFAERNQRKSKKLYDAIDHSHDFYRNNIAPECRSWMNVPFQLKTNTLTPLFLEEAKKEGLTNLKGHELVGGVRASIYNPMPEEGLDSLVAFMQDFMRRYR